MKIKFIIVPQVFPLELINTTGEASFSMLVEDSGYSNSSFWYTITVVLTKIKGAHRMLASRPLVKFILFCLDWS